MRNELLIFINGVEHRISGLKAMMSLSDYLRYEAGLVGTKVVCSEGDCGACTVLVAQPLGQPQGQFTVINSCISYLLSLDGSQLVTVEGLKLGQELSEVQKSMVDHHGAQCGFCTPGIVASLTGLFEEKKEVSEKHIKNCLTGNLCRCTGYDPIIRAGMAVDPEKHVSLKDRYCSDLSMRKLTDHVKTAAHFLGKGWEVYTPTTLAAVTQIKSQYPKAKLFSGGTDLGVLLNKGQIEPEIFINLNLVGELYEIAEVKDSLNVGARVTLGALQSYLESTHPEFAELLHIFASPQIKNYGTLVGNIANGSPIGDSLPYLYVSGAELLLKSSKGSRHVLVREFYKGYKQFDLEPDEVIVSVNIPYPKDGEQFKLYKTSQRKDLDISCVTLGILFERQNDEFSQIQMAIGGVGPTVIRAENAEAELRGKAGTDEEIESAVHKLQDEIIPLSDVRGSREFRRLLAGNLIRKFHQELKEGQI